MQFGSVCSGIEAASVAFAHLGWKAAWLAEIDPFACAVLAHHHPNVPNLGDMTAIAAQVLSGTVHAPNMLCGGTPCQAFSIGGQRQSLADERGNLTLKFVEIANAIDHVRAGRGEKECIVLWENVPGVLSTKDNAFGCFLAGLAGEDEPLQLAGKKWANAGAVYGPRRAIAWRTLDAQYFGVAQRRRRVFVVASARDGFDPAQVLFEWNGVRRDIAPRREPGQVAPTIPARSTAGGGLGTDFDCDGGLIQAFGGNRTSGGIEVAPALLAQPGSGWNGDFERETFLVQPVPAYAVRTANTSANGHGIAMEHANTLDSANGQCIAFDTTQITSPANYSNPKPGNVCHTLTAGAHVPTVAFPARLSGTQCASTENIAPAMGALNPIAIAVAIRGRDGGATAELGDDIGNCLRASSGGGDKPHVLVYTTKLHNTGSNNAGKIFEERTTCLDANSPTPVLLTAMQVRRLTPIECERLQGFPDGYTAIPWRGKPADQCPDGPRYKALGNSWAVPVAAWIGRRIQNQL